MIIIKIVNFPTNHIIQNCNFGKYLRVSDQFEVVLNISAEVHA